MQCIGTNFKRLHRLRTWGDGRYMLSIAKEDGKWFLELHDFAAKPSWCLPWDNGAIFPTNVNVFYSLKDVKNAVNLLSSYVARTETQKDWPLACGNIG
jgi:hypothetical protein